jgi:hypothetical protein
MRMALSTVERRAAQSCLAAIDDAAKDAFGRSVIVEPKEHLVDHDFVESLMAKGYAGVGVAGGAVRG